MGVYVNLPLLEAEFHQRKRQCNGRLRLDETYIVNDMLFSGDTLLIRGCGRTDFQNGDPKALFQSHQQLLTLADSTKVYPGHDYRGWTSSSIKEERQHNPRLQLDEEPFVQFMKNLKLPNPKLMDIAVPANQSCGQNS